MEISPGTAKAGLITTKRSRGSRVPVLLLIAACLILTQLAIFRIGFTTFLQHDITAASILTAGGGGSARDQLTSFKGGGWQRQQQQQQRRQPPPASQRDASNPDGIFNGFPIYHQTTPPDFHSSIHCVGENYRSSAWMHKSCQFSFLCLDIEQHDYVVFQSPREEALYQELEHHRFIDVSTSLTINNTMSIGGINPKWGLRSNGVSRMQWFPRVEQQHPISYYALPDDVILIPFHSLNANNPGHLLWDDFLPMFTLLHIFQLQDDYHRLLLLRQVLPGRGLWASCDFLDARKGVCEKMFAKFGPLMGISPPLQVTTNRNFSLTFTKAAAATTNLICAKRAVAGIGMLTDHGIKLHGWEAHDYDSTHNIGRGGMLYQFRSYMMENLGMSPVLQINPTTMPWHILVNTNSSANFKRAQTFTPQMNAIQAYFNDRVKITSMVAHKLSIQEQVRLTSQASIFITGSGGGAVTATFLPKGASLIIYFVEDGGIFNGRRDKLTAARLDWDIFNNMGYIRVHWLPLQTMDRPSDLQALVQLIDHEIHLMGDAAVSDAIQPVTPKG